MMGTAEASGENAAVKAAEMAISSPLLEEGGVQGARGVLINITGSSQLGLHEVNEACMLIGSATQNPDVQINFGVVHKEAMGEQVKITVIATGFERDTLPAILRKNLAAAVAPPPVPVEPPAELLQVEAPERPPEEEPVQVAQPTNGAPGPMLDDLEIPAILRRRLVQ